MWLDEFERFPPLTEIAQRMRAGTITSVRLVETCLERIEAQEPRIRAWAHLNPEEALRQAHQLDSVPPHGILHGVPVGVKDVIDTAKLPTLLGSMAESGRLPTEDAHCVTTLRTHGAVLLGKTTTSQYASLAPTVTRNPYNTHHTPGGSSAGSAAAVAAGMVPFSIGTQTLGSTIRPAAYCGVFGMKPSYGYLPLGGVLSVSQRLDTLGVFASCPEDLSVVIATLLVGRRETEKPQAATRFRAVRTPWWDRASGLAQEAFNAAVHLLDSQGFELSHDQLPASAEQLPALQGLIAQFDMTNSLRPRLQEHAHDIDEVLADKMAEGASISHESYWSAVAHIDGTRPAIQALFNDGAVMVTPATMGIAPPALEGTGDSTFNRPWSVLGNPVISVPVATDSTTGLPLSVQLIGSLGSDFGLIRAAQQLWSLARLQRITL